MELLPTGVISPKGKELEDFLNSRVKGQERAIRYLREYMEFYWADLRDPNRPIGNFLFIGPSGVGKTELAKALAEYLFGKPDRLTIIDCSEYSEGHEISDLTGAAPNYVGHGTSKPKLTQWNIDRHHVEHLCETGEFFDEYILEQRTRLVKFETLIKAIKAAIAALNKKIADLEEQIIGLSKGYEYLSGKIKSDKDKGEEKEKQVKEEIDKKINKELGKIMQDIKAAKENIKTKEKQLAVVENIAGRLKTNIEDLEKIRKVSLQERLSEFQNIINDEYYRHKVGRYISIIVWDEIEKANHKLFNLLLPVMDRGRLQLHDPPDEETIFTNAINIFTSNLGSDRIAESLAEISTGGANTRIGFGKPRHLHNEKELQKLDKQIYEMIKEELRRFFRPEFVGRINKLVVFRPLNKEALREIVDLRINERNSRQLIKFEVDHEVKDFLVSESLKNMSDGARLLDERIKQFMDSEVAPLINSGMLKAGDTVVVKLGKDKKLEFYKK